MRADELDTIEKLFFGLQAARQLLEFYEVHVQAGNVTMDGQGITALNGQKVEFTPIEYVRFAIQAQDIALAQVREAAQIKLKQQKER